MKGQPNRISVEVRELVRELVNDRDYQHRLRHDFRHRKVHPTIESLIWTYHLGKPRQDITLTGSMTVNARLEEEKRIFAQLEVADLEGLAAESQRLVDRATALAKLRAGVALPQDVVLEVKPDAVNQYTENEHPFIQGKTGGSDNVGYVADSAAVLEAGAGDAITPDDDEG